MTDRKLRVFLCHSSQDKPIVRELYQGLNAEGWIDPWLDEEKLLPGQDWDMEIEKAVETADTVIVCLSNNAVTKDGHIQKEIRKILDIARLKPEGRVYVIPLRLNDCQPPRQLVVWHYVDYFPPKIRKKTYKQIRESLQLQANLMGLNISIPPQEKNVPDLELVPFEDKKQLAGIFSIQSRLVERQRKTQRDLTKLNLIISQKAGVEIIPPPTGYEFENTAAKSALAKGNLRGFLNQYKKLLIHGESLESVISDLQEAIWLYPAKRAIWVILGDAYMKANKFQEALDCYSNAEELSRE